jgi:hypothetical protein
VGCVVAVALWEDVVVKVQVDGRGEGREDLMSFMGCWRRSGRKNGGLSMVGSARNYRLRIVRQSEIMSMMLIDISSRVIDLHKIAGRGLQTGFRLVSEQRHQTTSMAEAGTRLRHAVKYPTDDDDNPSTGLDEQEQEEVINSISQDDAETIATYRVRVRT